MMKTMYRIIVIGLSALLSSAGLLAQDKIAVTVGGSADEWTKTFATETITASINASRHYQVAGSSDDITLAVDITGTANFEVSFTVKRASKSFEKFYTCATRSGYADLEEVIKKTINTILTDIPRDASNARPQTPVQAQPTERAGSGRPVTPTTYTGELLYANGLDIVSNNRRLSQREVIDLMANTQASDYYKSGLHARRMGNILLWSGLGAVVAGAALSAADDGGGETAILGGAMGAAGIAAEVAGFILKGKSKRRINQSVEMYNRGHSSASAELKFGITRDGIGLAINF
jgi:hypothetical protein